MDRPAEPGRQGEWSWGKCTVLDVSPGYPMACRSVPHAAPISRISTPEIIVTNPFMSLRHPVDDARTCAIVALGMYHEPGSRQGSGTALFSIRSMSMWG